MRRFLFSGSIISAVWAGINLVRQTIYGPRNWRMALLWASWLISVVLAVAAVLDRSRQGIDDEV